MQPLTAAQLAAYLDRLRVPAPSTSDLATSDLATPDLATLAALQLAHLERIPFENLDIHTGRGIVLDDAAIYAKVVERHRGGYCYELNSLFARLLTTLGYRPTLASARVAREVGFGAEYDHLTLLVGIDGEAGGEQPDRWLVDVGFGDAFTAPIPLVDGTVRRDRDRDVRLSKHGDDWWYEEDDGSGWRAAYAFTARSRDLAAFHERNTWQQSSPDSHFTRAPVCSRLTPAGRITLSGDRYITTLDGRRSERSLDADQARAVLADDFGVQLPARPSLRHLPPELLANPTATLATVAPDGRPQVTLVWYLVEGEELCLSVTESTRKAHNLRRDGRCSLIVTDPETSNHYVEIRGLATVEPDDDLAFADRLGARYDTDMRTFDGPDDRRVRIAVRPVRIVVTDVRG